MRKACGVAALVSAAGLAHAGGPLATIEDVVVGSSSSPRALQGIAAATLPGLGDTFFTSTGSCVPLIGTGNGLARFDTAWSLVTESDYGAEPCHFGDITIGSDGTIYAPASEYDGIGFTSDEPFQINRFSATDLGAMGAWDAGALYDSYAFDDLSGADYRHGDLYIVDYRDSSPDATNIYVFDLATDPPAMIDLISISSRKVNGIESYGNLLYISRDIDTIDAALDVYDIDLLTAGVNSPIDTYTFDISNGSSQLGQHSEGLTFRYGASGVELWVSAALGTIARRIALPAPPQRVTWTGAGSGVGEPFDAWGDFDFGWDGQPTADIDALIDFATAGSVRVDGPAACRSLSVVGDEASSQLLMIESGGALVAADATITGATLAITDGSMTMTDNLALAPSTVVRLDVGDGAAPARVACGGVLMLDGAIEIVSSLAPEQCVAISLMTAMTTSGAFASETLPTPAPGMRTLLIETTTSVDFVQTRDADFDADLQVDGADLGLLLGAWGQGGPTDLNGDGMTDGADLGLLLGAWGACG
jgi:hypothetical protein